MRLIAKLLLMVTVCSGALAAFQAPASEGLRVIIIDGDEAANIVADRLSAEPVIEVQDRENRRVAGAVVRFVIRRTVRGQLSAVFRNGEAEVRTLTDAVGRARGSGLVPLEPGSFEIEIQVSHQGQTATATIRHTNYATVADAQAAGRQPAQNAGSSSGTAQAAPQGAVTSGTGWVPLAIVSAVASGAAGGALALSRDEDASTVLAGRVADATVVASVPVGIHAATAFAFSAHAVNFATGALTYNWEFGDGATSSEPTPTHVYQAAGTYPVVVTVSDGRQSVRSETSVTVHTVTGTWVSTTLVFDTPAVLQLTQSGSTISGLESAGAYSQCVVTGAVQKGSPAAVLTVPPCPHPIFAPHAPHEYRLDLSADGQTLSGVLEYPIPGVDARGSIVFRR